ncbi:MAG: hypothetical protein WC535_08945, partial [Candidatus Cloacimonas sp.]
KLWFLRLNLRKLRNLNENFLAEERHPVVSLHSQNYIVSAIFHYSFIVCLLWIEQEIKLPEF